jgi:hypothetical protein
VNLIRDYILNRISKIDPAVSMPDLKAIGPELTSEIVEKIAKDERTLNTPKAEIQDKSVAIQPLLHNMGKVPDVKGMGLRDAIYLLESKGLTVRVKGVGKVVKQSIQPGTPLGLVKVIQIQLGKA